jgi:hypothetical protein
MNKQASSWEIPREPIGALPQLWPPPPLLGFLALFFKALLKQPPPPGHTASFHVGYIKFTRLYQISSSQWVPIRFLMCSPRVFSIAPGGASIVSPLFLPWANQIGSLRKRQKKKEGLDL